MDGWQVLLAAQAARRADLRAREALLREAGFDEVAVDAVEAGVQLAAEEPRPGLDVARAVPDAHLGDLVGGRKLIAVVEHGVRRDDERDLRA